MGNDFGDSFKLTINLSYQVEQSIQTINLGH